MIIPDIHRKSHAAIAHRRATSCASLARSRVRRRGRRPWRAAFACAAASSLALAVAELPRGARPTPPPFRAAHAAVASDNPLASAAGLAAAQGGRQRRRRRLRDGAGAGRGAPRARPGSAAAASPWSTSRRRRRVYALDFRERAPAAITPACFLKDGKLDPRCRSDGGLAVAVPGEVRGLAEMVRRWGELPFPLRRRRAAAGGAWLSGLLAAGANAWQLAENRSARRAANAAQAVPMSRSSPASRSPTARPGGGPISPGRWASCARAAPTPSTRARSPTEIVKAVQGRGRRADAPRISPATPRPSATPLGGALPRAARLLDAAVVVGRRRAASRRWASWRRATRRGGRPAARRARLVGVPARAGRGVQARLRRSRALPGRHRLRHRRSART